MNILFFVLLPHGTDSSRSTMKYQLQLLIFILLCLGGRLDASPLYDYGLLSQVSCQTGKVYLIFG